MPLMDERSPASTLLLDQEFAKASLSPSVFQIGDQDAPDLLNVILGSAPQSKTNVIRIGSQEKRLAECV